MYVTLPRLDSMNSSTKWLKFYRHRLWRLSPPYFVTVLIGWKLVRYFGDGPMWATEWPIIEKPCDDNWWTNLLYINNFYPKHWADKCMLWTWYLSVDTQLYVLGSIFIIIAYRFGMAGALASFLIATIGTLSTILGLTIKYSFPANSQGIAAAPDSLEDTYTGTHYDRVVYQPFYTRAAPFLIGLLTGYLLAKKHQFRFMNQAYAIFLWVSAFAMGLTVVYGLYGFNNHDYPESLSVLYLTFYTFLWGLSLAIVVYLCANEYGGAANEFLSWKGWLPFSRLSYGVYLVHPLLLFYSALTRRQPVYLDVTSTVFLYVGVVGLAHLFSALLFLCIECPAAALERMFNKIKPKE
eukprot:m.117361 g.117361  ORF g.117361 m.117361 type:complete len:351 (+) comp37611_c0_seq14:1070-2122(+)